MLHQLVAHGLPQPRHAMRLTAECEEDELGTFGPYRPIGVHIGLERRGYWMRILHA